MAATAPRVGVARLRRHPGFLLFWAGLSSFLIVGRKICLLSRRIPLIVSVVRSVDRLGSRVGLFRDRGDAGLRTTRRPEAPSLPAAAGKG